MGIEKPRRARAGLTPAVADVVEGLGEIVLLAIRIS